MRGSVRDLTKAEARLLLADDPISEGGERGTPYHLTAALVRDTHREFRRILHAQIADHGLSASLWSYMWALWQCDGLTQTALAAQVKLEAATVGSAVRVLERRGFLVRQQNPADRREWRIYLTPKSKQLKARLLTVAERINREALKEFDEAEVYDLWRKLIRLRHGLQQTRTKLSQKKNAPMRKKAAGRPSNGAGVAR